MKVLFPLVVAVLSFGQSHAQVPALLNDSASKSSSYYRDIQFLSNLQYGSANPSYIRNSQFRKVNDISISRNQEDGSFRPVDGALHANSIGAEVFGIRKMERTSFEGSIKYRYDNLNDMRWNGTVMTTPTNPFILADTLRYDTLTNDAQKESFILNGGVAYQLNDRLTLGLSTTYSVANKADQADPRLQSTAARTTICPGIDIELGNRYSLGVSGLVEIYHEDIASTVKDNMISEHNNVYIFKSLGTFEGKSGLGYHRRYDGTILEGAMQSSFTGNKASDFTEVTFKINKENSIDGGTSYKYQSGDYKLMTIEFKNRTDFRTGSVLNSITISAKKENGSGTWYNQKQIRDEWNSKAYEIISKEVVYKESQLTADFSYRMDLMKNGVPSLTSILNAGYSKVSVKQYPEENKVDYSKVNASLIMTKRFTILHDEALEISAKGLYESAISPLAMEIATPKPADKRMYRGYFSPKYAYLAGGFYDCELGIALFDRSLMKDSTIKLSANGGYKKYIGDDQLFTGTDRTHFNISIGLIF